MGGDFFTKVLPQFEHRQSELWGLIGRMMKCSSFELANPLHSPGLQGLPDQNNGTICLAGDRFRNITLNHLL